MDTCSQQQLIKTALEGAYGKWGTKYRKILLSSDREKYYTLLCSQTLHKYLTDLDVRAERLYSRTVTRMAKKQGVTDELKQQNIALWTEKMDRIKERAEKLVMKEVILA